MKGKVIIIISLFIILLTGCINQTVSKEDNEQYQQKIKQLQQENQSLKDKNISLQKEIDKYSKEKDELIRNIPIDFDATLIVEGVPKDINEYIPIKFEESIYLPLSLLQPMFGKQVKVDLVYNLIEIGDTSIGLEGFQPADTPIINGNRGTPIINGSSSLRELKSILGEPVSERSVVDEISGDEGTEITFEGVVINGLEITVSKPVLETVRGITVGSTTDEVIKKYGLPNSGWGDNQKWYYGRYKYITLWFEFKNNKVISFGKVNGY